MRHSLFLSILGMSAACSLLSPQCASAQQRPGEGTIRLGLDGELFGVTGFPDRFTSVSFLFEGASLGPSFAYGLTDMFFLGVRTRFGFDYVDPDFGDDATDGVVSMLPFFEAIFGSDQFAPYVGAQLGFDAVFPSSRDPFANITAGALGGVHIMLAEGFSFTPLGELNFIYNGAAERAGVEFLLGFSVLGWLGGVGSGGQQSGGDAQQPAYQSPPPEAAWE